MSRDDSSVFESEVRRVAKQLFPNSETFGPVILDGRERDGVYEDTEVVHVVEATISRRRDKALSDLIKARA